MDNNIGIKLDRYKRHRPTKQFLIPSLSVLIVTIIGIVGVQFLLKMVDLILFGLYAFFSILLGVFSCRCWRIGKKEYTPAVIYSGLAGVILSAIIYGIFLVFERNWIPKNIYMIVQSVLIFDFSIASAILSTAFTKRPATYVRKFPDEYKTKRAGRNAAIIKAAINSWDRGWALTVPDLASKISIKDVKSLTGYAVIVDTLFEEIEKDSMEKPGSFYENKNKWFFRDNLSFQNDLLDYQFPHSPGFDEFDEEKYFENRATSSTCPDCWWSPQKGKKKCFLCKGSGQRDIYDSQRRENTTTICLLCGGSGWRRCNRCAGTGEITLIPYLVCTRYHKEHKNFFDPTTGVGLKKAIYKARGNVIIETPIRDGLIDPETIITENLPKEAANLVREVLNATGRLQERNYEYKIEVYHQRLRLLEIPVSEVEYTYKSKDYRLWVYGYNNRVHARAFKSPKNYFRLFITIAVILIILGMNMAALWPVIAYNLPSTFFSENHQA